MPYSDFCYICEDSTEPTYQLLVCFKCHPLYNCRVCRTCALQIDEEEYLDDTPVMIWRCSMHHKLCRECQLKRPFLVCQGCTGLIPAEYCGCECCSSHDYKQQLCDCCRLLQEPLLIDPDWKVDIDV